MSEFEIPEAFVKYFTKNYEIVQRYRSKDWGIRPIGSNKYVTANEVYSSYSTLCDNIGRDVDITIAGVTRYINQNTPHEEEQERKTARQFIDEWMGKKGTDWKLSSAWKTIQYVKGGVPTNQNIDELRDDIMETVYNEQLPYKSEEIKCALNNKVRDENQNAVVNIFNQISYDPAYEDKCTEFLHGFYDYVLPKEKFEIFEVIMKHWGWTCKRKMKGMSVKWHIWPNLYGKTGLGKTVSITKMCAPMADYVTVTDISTLFDTTKEVGKMTGYYVMVFDELSVNGNNDEYSIGTLSEDNLSTLKSILTKEYLDVRVYQTQKQNRPKITFVPISCANHHLYDILFDETSMRRYFEFNCTAERPKTFDAVNKVLANCVDFWKGIDENNDNGYWDPNSAIGQEIEAIQKSYYPTKSTTKTWIGACHVTPGKICGTTAFKAYRAWCNETGNRSKNYQNWLKDMKHIIPDAFDYAGRLRVNYIVDDEDSEPITQKSANAPTIDPMTALGLGEFEDEDNV